MEQFFEKIKSDPALKAKYEAILKKHEAAKDRDAVAAELTELARSEGFDTTPNGVLSAFAPKGEIGEEELESVSGGGTGTAWCVYSLSALMGYVTSIRPADGAYEGLCSDSGTMLCTWMGCRCWGTSHCKDGWHKCHNDGMYIIGHATSV